MERADRAGLGEALDRHPAETRVLREIRGGGTGCVHTAPGVDDEIGTHPAVIEELALGSIRHRGTVLSLLGNLRAFPVLAHDEFMALVEKRRLWGRGLSAVDAHILGSVVLVPGAALWTRDSRLLAACQESGVPSVHESIYVM